MKVTFASSPRLKVQGGSVQPGIVTLLILKSLLGYSIQTIIHNYGLKCVRKLYSLLQSMAMSLPTVSSLADGRALAMEHTETRTTAAKSVLYIFSLLRKVVGVDGCCDL